MTPATVRFLLGFLDLLLEGFAVGAVIGLIGLMIVFGLYQIEKPALIVWERVRHHLHQKAGRFPW